jgi:hypothetical protein
MCLRTLEAFAAEAFVVGAFVLEAYVFKDAESCCIGSFCGWSFRIGSLYV